MRLGTVVGAVATALFLAGCGGAMPGFSPQGNSLTDGLNGNGTARPQSAKGKQLVQRSPWDVAALRSHPAQARFAPERLETVAHQSLRLRDVTFETEPSTGVPLTLTATLVTLARVDGSRPRLPALVLIGDRGATAPLDAARSWAARGYAALALSLPARGAGADKTGASSAPEWTDQALANPSPTTNPLYTSVAAVVASLNVLAAQPEIDTRRIGLMGEGWGGVVALLAGAVDDRPHALVVARAAGGLNRGSLAEALKKLSTKDRDTWTRDYDPDSYAQADHPATLFVLPLAAADPPLTAVVATFRSRAGIKDLALIPPDMKAGDTTTEAAWLASRLQGEAPLPEVRALKAEGDGALVQVDGKLPPRSVAVYYTAGDLTQADWKNVAGEKTGDHDWRCALPKPEAGKPLTVFAALTDARGAILCSEPGPLTAAGSARGKAIAARAFR